MQNKIFMKHIILSIALCIATTLGANAQIKVIDATDQLPIAAASIFDSAGNMIGITNGDGTISEFSETAYPVTVRCMGYKSMVINTPQEKTWEMTPDVYELEELFISTEKKHILKQTFYAREYFSMATSQDTITFFNEHMADRYIPLSKKAKLSVESNLKIRSSRCYTHYQLKDRDSISFSTEPSALSLLSIVNMDDEKISVPKSFAESVDMPKYYEEKGKSGSNLILKQNANSFIYIEDILALKKNHTWTPVPLKILGYTLTVNQLYTRQTYIPNNTGKYSPEDLTETNYIMEALGTGKRLMKKLNSNKPVEIYTMVEFYIIDRNYMSEEEAKKELQNKGEKVEIIVPDNVPEMNKATKDLIEEYKKRQQKR